MPVYVAKSLPCTLTWFKMLREHLLTTLQQKNNNMFSSKPGKRMTFWQQMWLRILRWENYPGLSEWAVNHMYSCKKEAEEDLTHTQQKAMWRWIRDRGEDRVRRFEDGSGTATSKGVLASTGWKRWGTDSSLESGGSLTLPIVSFSPVILILDFWLPKLYSPEL